MNYSLPLPKQCTMISYQKLWGFGYFYQAVSYVHVHVQCRTPEALYYYFENSYNLGSHFYWISNCVSHRQRIEGLVLKLPLNCVYRSIWIQLSMGLTSNYIWLKALIRRIGQFWSPPLDSEISVFWHKAPHNKSVRHIKQTCSAVGSYISQRPHEIRCRWLTSEKVWPFQTP